MKKRTKEFGMFFAVKVAGIFFVMLFVFLVAGHYSMATASSCRERCERRADACSNRCINQTISRGLFNQDTMASAQCSSDCTEQNNICHENCEDQEAQEREQRESRRDSMY